MLRSNLWTQKQPVDLDIVSKTALWHTHGEALSYGWAALRQIVLFEVCICCSIINCIECSNPGMPTSVA
jgi:hypothetical protein